MHPRITRRVMEAHEEEQEALASECGMLRTRLSGLQADLDKLAASGTAQTEANAALAEENNRLEREIDSLRERLEDADKELADRMTTEEQIRQFDAVLSKAEEMKRRYELRISRLRSIIEDMKKASGEKNPEAGELAVINMDTDIRRSQSRQSRVADVPKKEEQPDSDWLETLPD